MADPVIVQGGMGVGVSNWALARAVARAGQLGVVSGTGLPTVLARRLQDGDPGGHLRRAMGRFPSPDVVDQALGAFYVPGGRADGEPYRAVPMLTASPGVFVQQLAVLANFVEVSLAKEGHGGLVGVNYLEKIQLPNLASIYGAMLAGVDYVCMGAGIPWEIPGAIASLSRHEDSSLRLHVEGAERDDDYRVWFRPRDVVPGRLAPLRRPRFLAIVSSGTLAASLAKRTSGAVSGFVVEGHVAGGHNAPPRGPLQLTGAGEPVYGPKDDADTERMRALGLPFWLAGSYGSPDSLQAALRAGASGVQVGTPFAFCRESGLPADVKREVVEAALRGDAEVFTDPRLSPTGFPFKVVLRSGSLSEAGVYAARRRTCDMGYLRTIYKRPDGSLGYRCPAEPVLDFLRKGGRVQDTVGRKCLCNALMASIGLGQVRETGRVEQLLLTAGDCLRTLARLRVPSGPSYSALDVIEYILQPA